MITFWWFSPNRDPTRATDRRAVADLWLSNDLTVNTIQTISQRVATRQPQSVDSNPELVIQLMKIEICLPPRSLLDQ